MAANATPREKLDQIFQFLDRAKRYWWLTAGLMVVGGVLSVLFATSRPKAYTSTAVLYYQEHIQTSLLQNRDVSSANRNIGERYRELLLARNSLVEIVRDPAVNPFPDILATDGEEAAVEELRSSVSFRPRGAQTFVIGYTDPDPDRAKLVAERLTQLLRNKAAAVKLGSAQATADFAALKLDEASQELQGRQNRLTKFLVAHPEFVLDAQGVGGAEGAGIRASQERPRASTGGAPQNVLQTLERQRARIQARIANPSAPVPVAPTPSRPRQRTAAQQAADAKVAEVERDVASAARALEDAQARYTDKHPSVLKAKEELTAAQGRLKTAKAAVPADSGAVEEDPVAALPADPTALRRELAEIERQIAAERARVRTAPGPAAGSGSATAAATAAATTASSVEKLEGDYQELKLDVDEQKKRVDSLAESVFRTRLEADQRLAEQGESLSVVDAAFKPLQPTGKPKKQLLMTGMMLFTVMGVVAALALALLDDRIYRRGDLEALPEVRVLATIPRVRGRKRGVRRLLLRA